MPENASAALNILADNLDRLRAWNAALNTQSAIGRAAKVDQKTVGRILNKAHEPQLNVVAKLAKAFGLEAWQMLVPDLDPENPQQLASAKDAQMYEQLRGLIAQNEVPAASPTAQENLEKLKASSRSKPPLGFAQRQAAKQEKKGG